MTDLFRVWEQPELKSPTLIVGWQEGAGRVSKSLAKDAATSWPPPGLNVAAGEAFDHTLGKKIENSLSNVRKREDTRTQTIMNPLGETDSTFHGPRYSPSGTQVPYK